MAAGTRTLSSVVSPIRNSSVAIKDSKKKDLHGSSCLQDGDRALLQTA